MPVERVGSVTYQFDPRVKAGTMKGMATRQGDNPVIAFVGLCADATLYTRVVVVSNGCLRPLQIYNKQVRWNDTHASNLGWVGGRQCPGASEETRRTWVAVLSLAVHPIAGK